MSNSKPKLARRHFLLAMGAGSAATAAALVAKSRAQKSPAAPDETPQSRGYADTAHIRNYYRTAKV